MTDAREAQHNYNDIAELGRDVIEDVSSKKDDKYQYTHEIHEVDGKDYRTTIPKHMAFSRVVDGISTYSQNYDFCGVVLIGMSGTGKSNVTSSIIDGLHKKGKHYHVTWIEAKDEFKNFDKIIKKLPVGVPHIMILSDASYAQSGTEKEQVEKIQQALTTIRHKVKSKVIFIMQIHYSKALPKFFRNQPFTILTSMSNEERDNLITLFGKASGGGYFLRNFSRFYRDQSRGKIKIDTTDSRSYSYKEFEINKPYRLVAVYNNGDLHFSLVSKPKIDWEHGQGNTLTTKEVMDDLEQKYGLSKVKKPLLYWALIHGKKGNQILTADDRPIWNYLVKMKHASDIDFDNMVEEFNRRTGKGDGRNVRRKHKKWKWRTKDQKDESIFKLAESRKSNDDVLGPPSS